MRLANFITYALSILGKHFTFRQVCAAFLWHIRTAALHTSPYQTGQTIRGAGAQR